MACHIWMESGSSFWRLLPFVIQMYETKIIVCFSNCCSVWSFFANIGELKKLIHIVKLGLRVNVAEVKDWKMLFDEKIGITMLMRNSTNPNHRTCWASTNDLLVWALVMDEFILMFSDLNLAHWLSICILGFFSFYITNDITHPK